MSCRCATAAETVAAAGLALAHEEVQQEQVGVDAVALGQVHAEAVAAGLLAAHHGPGLDHLGTDVLEADRASRGPPRRSARRGGRPSRSR